MFVDRLTAPGDVVLDSFAGFGTTPVVAEDLGREGWGVELDAERAMFVRTRVQCPERIFEADARALDALPIPPVRLAITSPPYSSSRVTRVRLSARIAAQTPATPPISPGSKRSLARWRTPDPRRLVGHRSLELARSGPSHDARLGHRPRRRRDPALRRRDHHPLGAQLWVWLRPQLLSAVLRRAQ